MERLTEKHYLGTDHYMKCSGSCNVDMDCIDCTSFDRLVERLAAYEDTGLEPLNVNNMKVAHGNALSTISELRKALVDKREELKTACDSISQLDGANSSLMAANEKLAADRKALINELCQYCGKYKHAHEGACDECKWRDM